MPKRSSGCDLCRKRKVRCDEARPRCQRCTNFGASCPGYGRTESVVFRDQTTTTASKATTKRVIKQQPLDSETFSPPESLISESSTNSLTSRRSLSPISINSTPEVRTMLLAKFFDAYLPQIERDSPNTESQYGYLLELPRSDTNNLAFTTAVDALTLVQLGTFHGDQRLLHESRLTYGKALAYLYRALLHPKLQAQDETLAAVAMLGLCDFFRGTSQNGTGWLSHASGAKGLLKHRGPSSIKSPLALKLFLNQRNTSILSGLLTRRAVFFDSPGWLELSAGLAANNKWVALTEIMVKIPALLEDTDRIIFSQSHDSPSHEISDETYSVLERYSKLQKRLQIWYNDLTASFDGPISKNIDVTELTEFWNLCPDTAFPTVLEFQSFTAAYLHSLYSLSSYVICTNAADVRATLPSHPQSPPLAGRQPLPSLMILRHLAHSHIFSLIRSVPYLCTSEGASVGRIQCLAFLWFAQDYFGSHRKMSQQPSTPVPCPTQDYSEQEAWCWRMFGALAEYGIVPPRVSNLPVNSNKAGRYAHAPRIQEDVGDDIGLVVKQLGFAEKPIAILGPRERSGLSGGVPSEYYDSDFKSDFSSSGSPSAAKGAHNHVKHLPETSSG